MGHIFGKKNKKDTGEIKGSYDSHIVSEGVKSNKEFQQEMSNNMSNINNELNKATAENFLKVRAAFNSYYKRKQNSRERESALEEQRKEKTEKQTKDLEEIASKVDPNNLDMKLLECLRNRKLARKISKSSITKYV